MAKRAYTGDALAIAQRVRVRIQTTGTGSEHTGETADLWARIGRKTLKVQSNTVEDEDLLTTLMSRLVSEWNNSEFGEFAEVTASRTIDELGEPVVELLADTAGKSFGPVTFSAPYPTIDVDTVQEGSDGQNAIQEFYFTETPDDGTFTIIINLGSGPETSAAIAAGADGDTITAALIAGTTLQSGDVEVSGAGTQNNPYSVEYMGNYAETAIALLGVDASQLLGNGAVFANVVQASSPGTSDSVQYIYARSLGASGYFVQFKGTNSSIINFTDNAAAVQAKLELMATIGSGNVEVFGGGYGSANAVLFCIRFKGALGQTSQPNIAMWLGSGGSGGAPGFSGFSGSVQDGGAANNHDIHVLFHDGTGGTFTVTVGANTTAAQQWDISDSGLESALEGLASVGAGNATVVKALAAGSPNVWIVKFDGSLAGTNVSNPTANYASITGDTTNGVSNVLDGGATSGTNQIIAIYTNGEGGTFSIIHGDITESGLSYAATTAAIKAALETLYTTGTFTVTGAGTAASPWLATVGGGLAGTDIIPPTGDGSLLTGGFEVVITEDQAGFEAIGEVWNVIIWDASGGNFQLELSGRKTANIAFGASAATVRAALEALTIIGSGNVTVSGSGTKASPYVISLTGDDLLGIDFAQLTAYNEDLTGSASFTITQETLQAPLGPQVVSDPLNWIDVDTEEPGLPEEGDDVFLEFGDENRSLKWDLSYFRDQGIHFNSFTTYRKFEDGAEFGLPVFNEDGNYYEYRPRHLEIGLVGDHQVTIGQGNQGTGSSRMNLDVGPDLAYFRVLSTNGPERDAYSAMDLLGTNTGNVLELVGGYISAAVLAGQVMNFARIIQRDGSLILGKGVTVGELGGTSETIVVDKTGGSIEMTEASINGLVVIRG